MQWIGVLNKVWKNLAKELGHYPADHMDFHKGSETLGFEVYVLGDIPCSEISVVNALSKLAWQVWWGKTQLGDNFKVQVIDGKDVNHTLTAAQRSRETVGWRNI